MREAKYNRPLTVAFTKAIFEEIKRLTDQQKISMAQWVRTVAEQALQIHSREEKNLKGTVQFTKSS